MGKKLGSFPQAHGGMGKKLGSFPGAHGGMKAVIPHSPLGKEVPQNEGQPVVESTSSARPETSRATTLVRVQCSRSLRKTRGALT